MSTHIHFRPYYEFSNGCLKWVKQGHWHHSQRKAWEEIETAIHKPDMKHLEDYGVERYKVKGTRGDCCEGID